MERTLKEKTARGLLWGGISNGFQQILNLIIGLILARILDANDYGMIGMLAIFNAIANTLQESGFTMALANQKDIRDEDYNSVFWFSSLSGLFFYIVLFFLAPLIAKFYDSPQLLILSRILFLSFLLGGIGIASNAFLFRSLMVKEKALIDTVSLAVSGIIGVVLALKGFAYMGLAIQTVVYGGVGTILKLYYSPWKPILALNFNPLKKMFNFSYKLILTNIIIQINANIFSVILGKLYNARQLGYYTQGQKWMGMGNQLIGGMLNSVSQPVLVQVVDDLERQCKVFRKMVRFGAFISFPAMLGLAFVSKEFVVIFLGEKWLPSVPFLQLFCIWGAFWYLQSLYTNLLISHGKSNMFLFGVVIVGSMQLLFVVLMSFMGIYEMVIGYIAANLIGILLWHYLANKILDVRLLFILIDILPYLFSAIFAIGFCYIVLLNISNLYLLLLLKILIVSIVYLSIMKIGNSVILKDVLSLITKL